MIRLGVLAAIGYALWRAYEQRKVDTGVTWDRQPFPYPPRPRTEARDTSDATSPPRASGDERAERAEELAGASDSEAGIPASSERRMIRRGYPRRAARVRRPTR